MSGDDPIDGPRETLRRAASERGVSLSALSRMIGRNVAYLQQYVGRGSPRLLPERERQLLADFLEISQYDLVDPADRPGPPNPAQVRELASMLHAPRRDRRITDIQLSHRIIEWLKAEGGLR